MKQKLKIIGFSIILVIILGLLSFGIVKTNQFNKTKTTVEYTSADLFKEETEANCLKVNVSHDDNATDVWNSTITDGTLGDVKNNYHSEYYLLTIENKGENTLNSYAVKVVAQSKVYLDSGWCGTFEIHQFRDGKELVQEIDFKKKPSSKDAYSIDIYENVAEDGKSYFEVPLEKDDYFLYLPSAEDGFVPLSPTQGPVYPGFIVLSPQGSVPSFTAAQYVRTHRVANTVANTELPTSVTMNPREDTWNKIIDPTNKGITQPNYMGQTYDLIFTNNNKKTLNSYSLTFNCETDVYLSSAWNGSVEVHQGDKTEYIEDLRSFVPNDKTQIQYIKHGSDIFIPLTLGDSFTYYPSEEKLETPLNYKQSITAGVILYSKIGTELYGSAKLDLGYHIDLMDEPIFLCAFIFLIIWLFCVVFEVLFQVRISSYRKQREHQEKIIVESIETFTGFIDAKDPYTNGHSHRVAYYTKLIADHMGYSEENLQRIYYIALLHDCGKIGIPDSILCKPSKLTDEEYKIIKSHPVLSAQVLNKFTSIEGIREGVLYHHERYDGKGYPEGKKGEEIPLDARIICVADSFDAMNSDRCYRPRLTKDQIINELEKNKGAQFDPEIAEIMLFLILSGKINMEA